MARGRGPLGQPPRYRLGLRRVRPVGQRPGWTRGGEATRPRQRVGVPLRGGRRRSCRPPPLRRPGSTGGIPPGRSGLPAVRPREVVGRGIGGAAVKRPAVRGARRLASSPIRVTPTRERPGALPVRRGGTVPRVREGGAVLPVRDGRAVLSHRVGGSAARRALSRAALTEVAKPVVVGVRRTERVAAVVAEPAAPKTAAWLRHRSNRQRPARMSGAELGTVAANGSLRAGLGGEATAAAIRASSVVAVSRGPSAISLILRPTRCHTQCYS
jgi:hypothetical protein